MCKFFSFISNGDGNFLYFTKEHRELSLKNELKDKNNNQISYDKVDSHAALAAFFGLKEDTCNKYEFIPNKDSFVVDQINNKKDDMAQAEAWARSRPWRFIEELRNSGDRNSGDRNSGDRNSGEWNSGNCNSGDGNSGDCNSGNWNSSDCNSGDCNSGYRNSGNCNSGNCNSGNCNSGNWNSGDCNSGNWNSGFFNTDEPNVRIFNRQTKLRRDDPRIQKILGMGPTTTIWISWSDMTDLDKKDHPKAYVCDGYLKTLPYKEAWAIFWDKSSQEIKDRFRNLPFFDPKIFEEITGIKTTKLKMVKK